MNVATESDVIEHGSPFKELELLEGPRYSHLRPLIGPGPGDILSFEFGAPPLGVIEAVDAVQEYRFACAIGTNDGEDLPFFHFQAHTHQGLDTPESHINVFDLKLDLFGDGH